MTEYSRSHLVWVGITTFLTQIRKYIAAIKILESNPEYKNNPLLEISLDAISAQLLLDVAKIFDRAHYGHDDNCSINLLKQLCIDDKGKFSLGEEDPLVLLANTLCNEYKRIISKKLRDKKIAHYDLNEVFTGSYQAVDYNDLKKLIETCSILIINIGKRLLGVEMHFPEFSELEKIYAGCLTQSSSN